MGGGGGDNCSLSTLCFDFLYINNYYFLALHDSITNYLICGLLCQVQSKKNNTHKNRLILLGF